MSGLIETTVEAIRIRIVSGEWAIGSRIPTEPALVSMLGVGRNTVREAVQALVHSGLIERRQGSGTYVVGTSELAVTIGRELAHANQDDVVAVRRALEVEASRLAAVKHNEQDAAAIIAARSKRAAAYDSGDLNQMVSTDVALHRTIVRASGNHLLIDLYENLIDAISANIRFNFSSDVFSHGAHSHDKLVEAILSKDTETAGHEAGDYLTALLDTAED